MKYRFLSDLYFHLFIYPVTKHTVFYSSTVCVYIYLQMLLLNKLKQYLLYRYNETLKYLYNENNKMLIYSPVSYTHLVG